jgi:predicted nucleotidyltransferase
VTIVAWLVSQFKRKSLHNRYARATIETIHECPKVVQDQSLLEDSRIVKAQVSIPREELSDFCQRWKVTELAVFGSVLRGDFGPDSDVDVLVTFASQARWSLFDLVVMESELGAIMGRDVDLVERTAVEQAENYIRRKSILSNTEVIYGT